MKIAPFWASIALFGPRALAATSATATATSTATAATCTASLITTLCDYPEPVEGTAVASTGASMCWDYCNANPPCSFVIFAAVGNPTLGYGDCWVYPGESYNASEGTTSGCSSPYLYVYDEPTCSGGSATTTTTGVACPATATPTPIASVCGYPTPPDDCFDDCSASSGAVNCLSQCANADSCSYAVFNPADGGSDPYLDGTCWMYPNGTYNAASATSCSGEPTQFVYNNTCPKPTSSSSPASSSVTITGTATAGATSGATTGSAAATGSGGTEIADSASASTTSSKNSAPTGLSLTNPLAIGLPILLWQAL